MVVSGGAMWRSSIASLWFAAALVSGFAATDTHAAAPVGTGSTADVQLLTIELRDRPDPHTGTLRVIEGAQAWPLELDPLLAAVSRDWAEASVYNMRRETLVAGVIEQLEETTVRVLDIGPNSARLSVKLDGATQPLDVTVPINSTVVVGSEADGQRHAFVAVSALDRATRTRNPEVLSTREPGVTSPMRAHGGRLAAPAAARANGQKGVVLDVEVDASGNVVMAHALDRRYLSATDAAAIEKTVSEWKFRPAMRNGKPVRVMTTITAVFSD
jgi:Gram-negative bacterial TonB protein C-terminal